LIVIAYKDHILIISLPTAKHSLTTVRSVSETYRANDKPFIPHTLM